MLVSSSFIQSKLTQPSIQNAFTKLRPYEAHLGLALFVLGVVGLLERLGFFYLGIDLGSSFPQALPAIFSGIVLGKAHFEKFTFMRSLIATLEAQKVPLGILTILCGLGSILFGCIAPVCYPGILPF